MMASECTYVTAHRSTIQDPVKMVDVISGMFTLCANVSGLSKDFISKNILKAR